VREIKENRERCRFNLTEKRSKEKQPMNSLAAARRQQIKARALKASPSSLSDLAENPDCFERSCLNLLPHMLSFVWNNELNQGIAAPECYL
jgi:hypothetical protein